MSEEDNVSIASRQSLASVRLAISYHWTGLVNHPNDYSFQTAIRIVCLKYDFVFIDFWI